MNNMLKGWSFSRKTATTLFILCLSFSAFAQLQVNNTLTNAQLAQLIVGGGVTISNVTVNCPAGAYGSFDGTASNIGLDEGLILTTGDINNAVGPNSLTSAGTDNGAGGYALLNGLAGATTFDGCVFEFDIQPLGDTIRFNFVFGSEEYPEFVNSGYNDAFGFFISGPNPFGGNYNNQNIALIPGTATPVTIDNVNNINNNAYYNDNTGGATVEYDGFTQNLVAQAAVDPCETYHLILSIADAGDGIYDSGVFVEAISSNVVTITATTAGGIVNAIEGCNDGIITFTRDQVNNNPFVVDFQIGGSATNGSDYQTINNQITIPAGQASTQLDLLTIADGITEPIENFVVRLINPCTGVAYDSAELFILDDIIIDATPDTATTCPGLGGVQLNATGALTWDWSPPNGLSATNIANPIADPATTTTYIVEGEVASCIEYDTVTVVVNTFTQPVVSGDTSICPGESVQLQVQHGINYSWSPPDGLSDTTIANPIATPDSTTTYTVTFDDSCGVQQQLQVTVTVDANIDPVIQGLDSVYCAYDAPSVLTGVPSGGTFSGTGITANNSFDPQQAGPGGPYAITYSVTSSAGCSGIDTAYTTVAATPLPSIDGLEPLYCEGQGAVTLTPSPAGGTLTGPGLNGNTFYPDSVSLGTTHVITYTYTDTATGCVSAVDTSTVVNTLPAVDYNGLDNLYCVNDVPSLLVGSPQDGTFSGTGIYSTNIFDPGIAGPGGPYDITYTYTDSATTCTDSAIYQAEVLDVPAVDLQGLDSEYCIDDTPVQMTLTPTNGGVLTGNGTNGNFFDPLLAGEGAHPISYSFTDPVSGCADTAEQLVTVYGLPEPLITGDDEICEDEVATLNVDSNYASISWSTGESTQSIDVTTSGDYSVTVENIGGCVGTDGPFNVEVKPVPLITAYGDTTIMLGNSAIIGVSTDVLGLDNVYNWSPADYLDCNDCEEAISTPLETTVYSVQLTVDGCESNTDSVLVEVVEPRIIVPTAFSPNGDGFNDDFYVFNDEELEITEFKVFNRWGELLHDNPTEPWDGYYKGELQQIDTYVFYVVARDARGDEHMLKGNVTLVK